MTTDYQLTILDMEVKDLALETTIITGIIFGLPTLLIIFIVHQKRKQRY